MGDLLDFHNFGWLAGFSECWMVCWKFRIVADLLDFQNLGWFAGFSECSLICWSMFLSPAHFMLPTKPVAFSGMGPVRVFVRVLRHRHNVFCFGAKAPNPLLNYVFRLRSCFAKHRNVMNMLLKFMKSRRTLCLYSV